MAKSQQTFNKSEKEKKRLKKREEKRKKMEARRAEAKLSGKKGIEFAESFEKNKKMKFIKKKLTF